MGNISWKRVVIKVGSALIAPNQLGCSSRYLLSIANFIVECRVQGIEVVLVSSGSVAAGTHLFSSAETVQVAMKKAMAAAGQAEMIATWDRLFDFPTAQLLLTRSDLQDRERYISIRETILALLAQGILPILNENDAVISEQSKVGDNDNLSAMVAAAADADCLVICSDVDGLFTQNPQKFADATLIPRVTKIDEYIYNIAGGAESDVGTGGMKTKIEAAEKAVAQGITTFIVNGHKSESFEQLMQGKNPGTQFVPDADPLSEHDHWLTHTSQEQGEVIVEDRVDLNDTNLDALSQDEILQVNGEFSPGDTVVIRHTSGGCQIKASVNYGSCLLNFFAEKDDKEDSPASANVGSIISQEHSIVLENT